MMNYENKKIRTKIKKMQGGLRHASTQEDYKAIEYEIKKLEKGLDKK